MNRRIKAISTIGILCFLMMSSSAFAQHTSSGSNFLEKIRRAFTIQNKKKITPEEAYEKAMSPEFREKHHDMSEETKTSAFVKLLEYSAKNAYLPAQAELLKLRWMLVSSHNSGSPLFAEGVDYRNLDKKEKQERNRAFNALKKECASMKIKAERENHPLAQYAYGTYCTGAKREWDIFSETQIHAKAKPWYDMAMAYYRPLAERGDAEALLMMSRMDSQNQSFWNTRAIRAGRYEAFCQLNNNLNHASQEDRNLVIKAVESGNTCALHHASFMIADRTKDKLLKEYLAIADLGSIFDDLDRYGYKIDGIAYISLAGEDGGERDMNFEDLQLRCSPAQRKRLDKVDQQANQDPAGFVRTYLK